MEYQKIRNLLDNMPNQQSKLKKKNWVQRNDDARGKYNTNSQISMPKSRLCDYSDAHIIVNGTITVPNNGTAAALYNRKNIIIKNCAPFTDSISEINNI